MAAGRSILIVEDDAAVQEVLADHLAEEHGFIIFTAATLAEAEKIIAGEGRVFDAVILDVGMPDGDGRDFCADLRRQGHKMPVILLTGRDAECDVVRGFSSGANDYIAKPFRLKELLARLRALWRAFESSDEATFSLGPFTFRPSKKLLHDSVNDRRIRLTDKEVAILRYLYRSDANRVDREKLLVEIWGQNADVNTHTLETHIYRLRQKIEPDPRFPSLLVFERGGYRLNLPGKSAGEA
ncbi:MAG TPA: response regulator transcription factor [Acetobacteraceae bacterium]|nr:response regulator transcription factor [Acetobacteraceae bacterium]